MTKNLSQEELAYRTGLHEKYIGRLERGQQQPGYRKMHGLSKVLRFDMNHIGATVESEMQNFPPPD